MKQLLIDATHHEETRVVIADENRIHEFDISATSKTQNKGNIYLAKITRVEPSLQAAFVEYGAGRQGFLPFSEIHPDYYQIPVADRKKLIEEAAAAIDEADEEQEERPRRGHRRRRPRRDDKHAGPQDEQNAASDGEGEATLPVEGETVAAEGDNEKISSPDYLAEIIPPAPAIKSDIVEIPETETERAETSHSDDFHADDVDKNDSHAQNMAHQQDHNEQVARDRAENEEDEHGEGKDPNSEVDVLVDDDDFMRRRKASFLRRYKIQEVIKRNQVILIQVVKEERGNKGASLSTYISLAGRYCVLMPNSPKTGGISRKISSNEDRRRLKEISEEMRDTHGLSAIIRTAGIDRTRAEIKRDYDYLVKLWSTIRELTLSSTAPALVYEEADIIKRSLRDLYSSDITEVIVAGEESFKRTKEFMKIMMPSHVGRVKQHKDPTPIFYAYDVEDQLLRMHEPQVRLESGGSIVLNPTEALVSIDVNSGRSTTERNVEETAVKTNLEAAQEIARQLRLRDLAGLIVIDFIDMFDFKHRRNVERQLKDALKNDRAKIQVGRISAFGLLEMSRQRLRPSLAETNTISCPFCEGKGTVLSPEALGVQMVRLVEKEASTGDYVSLSLKVPQHVALYLLNTKRQRLLEIEAAHNLKIDIQIADHITSATGFILERYTAEGQKTEVNGTEGLPAQGKRNRTRKRKRDRDRPEQRGDRPAHLGGQDNHESDSDNDEPYVSDEAEEREQAAQPERVQGEHGRDHAHPRERTEGDRGDGTRRPRRRGGRRRGGRDRDGRERGDGRDKRPHHGENAPHTDNVPHSENAPREETVRHESSAPTHSPAPANDWSQPSLLPAETAVAQKPEPKSVVAEAPAAKAEPVAKVEVVEAAEPAKKVPAKRGRKPKSETTDAPAASKSAARELEHADGDDGEKKGDGKRGWWRRIVE